MTKAELREVNLKRRLCLDDTLHTLFNTMLIAKVKQFLEAGSVMKIGIFYPMRSEVRLLELGDEYETFLPKIVDNQIVFYQDFGSYVKAAFGTVVPSHDDAAMLDTLDAVLVPGLVFDKKGYRIGYGKGYYDAFLSRYKGLKIGVCFDIFVMESLPNEPHDMPVDVVITDQRVIKR